MVLLEYPTTSCIYLYFAVSDLFVGNSWRLHPDWVYCEYNYAGTPYREFHTPEDNMKHFFVKMQQPDWNWGTPNVLPLPNCKDKQRFSPNCFKCKSFFKINFKIPTYIILRVFQ